MELEFDMLGVAGKLVKYILFSLLKEKIEKNIFFFIQAAQTQLTSFWCQGFRG
jgi:hypothetical protein